MKVNKKIYYFPFDGGSSVYNNAYDFLNRASREFLIETLKSRFDILKLPFQSVVIVEAISSISWEFFIRFDLKILHTPRGGASLKIGWKTVGDVKWHIKLRLLRRNFVLFRNKIIARYYSLEEGISHGKVCIGPEVVDEYFLTMPTQEGCVHISLSECWSGKELAEFIRELIQDSNLKNNKITISIHPAIRLSDDDAQYLEPFIKEFGEEYLPEILITDCVSTVFIADKLRLKIKIVKERQSPTRELFIHQASIFCDSRLNIQALETKSSISSFFDYEAGSSPVIETLSDNSFTNIIKKVSS